MKLLGAVIWVLLLSFDVPAAPFYMNIGTLPNGGNCIPLGVSADGSVVVGVAVNASGQEEAFRWTGSTGVVGLGTLPDDIGSKACGVSADGSVVVGVAVNASGQEEAFRWTQSTGIVGLGTLSGGDRSAAYGVSDDGAVVVGTSGEAFRWTQADGMVGLGIIGPPDSVNNNSTAYGVSGDGSIVAGYHISSSSPMQAFRWTAADGMVGLGTLTGLSNWGADSSTAFGVSADGSTLVGDSSKDPYGSGYGAFRWTQADGMVGLDKFSEYVAGRALAVSDDGSRIVGYGYKSNSEILAFIWDAQHGMRNLQDVLVQDYGLDLTLTYGTLETARSISADGLTIVGDTYGQAWLARLEPHMSFSFEEDGDTTTDVSGDGNIGIVYEAIFAPGKGVGDSNAFEFNWSSANYIQVPYRSAQTVTDAITLEAWVYPTAWDNIYAGYNRIVSKYPCYLLRGVNGLAQFNILTENHGYKSVLDSQVMKLNQWHYLVGTFDGKSLALYVDGVQKDHTELLDNDTIVTNQLPIYIGENPKLNEGFSGIIDEVSLYGHAKQQSEIAETYESYTRKHDWPMFHNNLQHTGRSIYTGPEKGTVLWTYDTGGEVNSSPTIDKNGIIYVGSNDNNLYAVNPDGTLKWIYSTNGGIQSSPAIGRDGTIYVGSRDNNVYSIRPDGTLKWYYSTDGEITSSPTIGNDGTIYISSYDSNLYAFNPDGTLKWDYSAGWATPTIGRDGTVYAGFAGLRLHALTATGSLKWQSEPASNWPQTVPALSPDGTAIYYGADDGYLYARNTSDGSLKWKSPFTYGGIQSSPAVGNDGTLYVGTQYGSLWALNPEDGTLKWNYYMSLGAWSSPAIGADGTIYFATGYGHLFAMNPAGTSKWVYEGSYESDGHFHSSPAIGSNGVLYVGSTNGKLYAFGAPPCLADFDGDSDVDGTDLATFSAGGAGITLEELTSDFGRTDCPVCR
ncbi:MAG: PQQ-binding-like beta-propeller repeat protein [Proteobacteria bacterium]|nr:PQQ-binding-like beta-propeller repeat protein [Pseudomonadota bacterium]MCG2748606.1 PQQ-binding-like beta-propeller repeat protein [Desulfobulbaceae bacterium]